MRLQEVIKTHLDQAKRQIVQFSWPALAQLLPTCASPCEHLHRLSHKNHIMYPHDSSCSIQMPLHATRQIGQDTARRRSGCADHSQANSYHTRCFRQLDICVLSVRQYHRKSVPLGQNILSAICLVFPPESLENPLEGSVDVW